jgi:tripartite-type tricarboxylate transporter receptor subunit TctC
MFKAKAGIFAVHIPYNGGAPSQLALLSGTVDYTLDNLATSGANIRAGKVLPLAVTTLQRSPLLPDVPPMADLYPGFEIDTWWGLIAPAGTPVDVVARLNKAFVAALEAPDVKARFLGLLTEPVSSTPEQFAQLIRREHARYEGVVKASGAKVD